MVDWLRFVLIVFLVAVDDLLGELAQSFYATRDFVGGRLKWILRDKLLVLWRGRAR
jgi:hypothetical protein